MLIHSEIEQRDVALAAASRGRDSEVEELNNAVMHHRSLFRDSRQGAAALETRMAILEPAGQREETFLSQQGPASQLRPARRMGSEVLR